MPGVEQLDQTVVDVAVLTERLDEVHAFQTQQRHGLFDVHLTGATTLRGQGVHCQEQAARPGTHGTVDQQPCVRTVLGLHVTHQVEELERVMW